MLTPVINIDIRKITENTRVIVDFCGEHGIDVIGVTKVTCGIPAVARAMIEGGVKGIGESRIENINRLRASGINIPMTLLRIPPLSGVDEIVNSVDTSLNSELPVIRELSSAADRRGITHNVILMVDLGDLREGIWPDELLRTAAETSELPGIRLKGIGTNLTCYGGVLPSEMNMRQLADYAREIEDSLGIGMEVVSGGNSSSLELVRRGEMPKEVNQLRIGEAIMLGRETAYGKSWPGTFGDAFKLKAELIELKEKPSVPIGETGMDAFGRKPVFSDRGVMLRGILNIGREDVDIEGLTPAESRFSVIGASSDHLLLDITDSGKNLRLGDTVSFTLNYGALLAGMTSAYVLKNPILPDLKKPEKSICLAGVSPVFQSEGFRERFESIGFQVTEGIPGEVLDLKNAFNRGAVPFIAGKDRLTLKGMKAMSEAVGQSGIIILDSHASLMTSENAPPERKILSTVFGLTDPRINLSSFFSPENTVIIGLREAEKEESDIIRKLNLNVFTMEDIDILGIREVTRRAIRTATSGTRGFYLSFCQDVSDSSSEGLTARELHLIMELISDSGLMRAFDISGCVRKGQTDFSPLIHFAESAFGRKILKK